MVGDSWGVFSAFHHAVVSHSLHLAAVLGLSIGHLGSYHAAWYYTPLSCFSQHRVLIPALWDTDVQEWEINCMNRLVLEEASGGQDEGKHIPTIPQFNIRARKDSLQHSVDYNNEYTCSPIQTCADISAPLT
ncbi:hypothetical protein cypCar_00040169 [Cyprinus carpio]|nr:hypothetical protein cypCar_00040169 [Cyprinus carpio]